MVSSHVPIENRAVSARDGTRLAYHVTEAPAPDAKVIVLANGLGGPHLAWRGLIDYLADRYRFLTWDYRGLFGSGRPPRDEPHAYAVERHVEDLEAVLAAEGIAEVTLVGWSMGVQVSLEAYRALGPSVVKNLVLLNGTFGRPLDTAVPVPFAKHVVPSALELADRLHGAVGLLTRGFAERRDAVRWMKRLGFLGETLDEEDFADVVRAFSALDMQAFLKNLRALGEHDASRILGHIRVPVLVVTGDRDRMTPRGLSQQMVRRIPAAEILVVRGGTHYTAVEFPELVGLRIERFLADRRY